MKVSINTVSIPDKGDFAVYGRAKVDGIEYALLIPKEIYVQFLSAVAVDEENLKKVLFLYEIQGGMYVETDAPELKELVYVAVTREQKERGSASV